MAIGLGCMRLSTDPARDPDRGRAVIAAAIDAGITLLDTADAYALDDGDIGHNERLIARTVAERFARRPADATAERPAERPEHVDHPVEIVTKGGLVRPGGAWQTDGRARHLADAARASRDRLGVAAIDLYLLHAVDPRVALATSVRALARLRDDGVARRIGLSNVGLTQLEAALAIAPIDAVEVELSLYKLDAIRGGLVAACAARGIRVLAHRPLGGPAGVRRAGSDSVLTAQAARLGTTPAELALAWLASLSPVIVPLPGATQVATAVSAARAARLVLDDEASAALTARFLAVGDPRVAAASATSRAAAGSASGATASAASGASATSGAAASATSRAAASAASGVTASFTSGVAAAAAPGVEPVGARARPETGTVARVAADAEAATAHVAGEPRERPEVVLVIGMPASGKSTLAADYAAMGYLRLNRDELGGSLDKLARRLDRELAGGARRIVLDNTYPTRASRAPVVEIARRHGATVRCVVMATTLEQAQHNAVARILVRHGRLLMPRGPAGEPSELGRAGEIDPRALFRFRRDHEPPRSDEGFAAIDEVPFVRAPGAARADGHAGHAGLIVELDDLVWRKRPHEPAQIELVPGVREGLAAWAGRVVTGTTWQPGLAGTDALAERLSELVGAAIAVAHCAHPPGPPVCWCRKPLPGLALALADRHGLDLSRTIHLGKGPADRGFAARAGMRYIDITAGWPVPEG